MSKLAWIFIATLSQPAFAKATLVEPKFVEEQKALTKIVALKNGVTVIFREVPGSDIVHFEAAWKVGSAHLPEGQRTKNNLAFEAMPFGSKSYPKARLYEIAEKYSFSLDCSGGIEHSSCQLETITDFSDTGFDVWSSVVLEPLYVESDVNNVRQRLQASYKSQIQNPDAAVNTVVNSIFYPLGHPYRLQPDESLTEITKFSSKDLVDYHKKITFGHNLIVAVVGPKYSEDLRKKIDTKFSGLIAGKSAALHVAPPPFKKDKAFVLNSRNVPTAYIRAKFNAPALTEKHATVASLLFEIFNEELGDEVRTKRSLSYATHAYTLQLNAGIGIWSSTTSKPKETLEVIAQVVRKLRDHKFSQAEVDEYKNGFATAYYLTQETHDALAAGLIQSWVYFNNTDHLYNMPIELEKVTTEEIHKLGQDILKNFRIGVIMDDKAFKKEWIKPVAAL